MLHSLSLWLLWDSAACSINTDFLYQIIIFLIFLMNVIFYLHHNKFKLDADHAYIIQRRTDSDYWKTFKQEGLKTLELFSLEVKG